MLPKAGQLFHLTTDILAIQPFEDRTNVVTIPRGSSVLVVHFPSEADDRMAEALWGGRSVEILGQDLCHRAEEIKLLPTDPNN